MIKARSNILFKDYLEYVFSSIIKKKIFLVFIIVSAAAFLLVIVNLILNTIKGNEITFINVLPLLVIIAIYLFYISMYYGMCKKQYKAGKHSFEEETDYIFLNNKFVIARSGTEEGYNVFYDKILSVKETKNKVYFYIGNDKSFMMKKNFIQGDINSLREIIKKHCVHANIKLRGN